jgi:sugar lactone lactonase YvrE
MKKILYSIILLSLTFNGCDSNSYLIKSWKSSNGKLSTPESVIYDNSKNLLYVSNVNNKSNPWKDNHGFISKLNRKGKILKLKWVENLKAPKGLTMGDNGHLFVADLDRVVDINSSTGKIIQIFKAPNGIDRLNDITYDDKRNILFVSDSKTKQIYKVSLNGEFSLFYDREKSKNAEQNGLLVDEDLLIMQGEVGKLKYLNIDTKSVSTITDKLDIAIDGITKYRDLGYIVSTWSGGVYFVSVNGDVKKLLGDDFKTADIFYSEDLDLLLIPDFAHSIRAYKIEGLAKEQKQEESQPIPVQIPIKES